MIILQQARGLLSSNDQLSLHLPFAATKSLTARVGPTPVFTRASTGTYFGPRVEFNAFVFYTTTVQNGRAYWEHITSGGDIYSFEYSGISWQLRVFLAAAEDPYYVDAAEGNEWRPDQADWSGSGISVTTSSTFDIVRAANGEPRFDHDPVTGICRGLLIEDARANLLLQSVTLLTQTVSVTAIAHTLSFYGTGTVVLSGAHSASINGLGAHPTLRTYSFTPTAGSLTLTVTGTVQFANLEVGIFATSWIPTTTSPLTRSADVCSISSIASFYGSGVGTIFTGTQLNGASQLNGVCGLFAGANQVAISRLVNNTRAATNGNAPKLTINSGTLASTLFVKSAFAFNTNDAAFANNGVSAGASTSVGIPSVTTFGIGTNGSQPMQSGTISEIKVFNKRLANAKLQALTA